MRTLQHSPTALSETSDNSMHGGTTTSGQPQASAALPVHLQMGFRLHQRSGMCLGLSKLSHHHLQSQRNTNIHKHTHSYTQKTRDTSEPQSFPRMISRPGGPPKPPRGVKLPPSGGSTCAARSLVTWYHFRDANIHFSLCLSLSLSLSVEGSK